MSIDPKKKLKAYDMRLAKNRRAQELRRKKRSQDVENRLAPLLAERDKLARQLIQRAEYKRLDNSKREELEDKLAREAKDRQDFLESLMDTWNRKKALLDSKDEV